MAVPPYPLPPTDYALLGGSYPGTAHLGFTGNGYLEWNDDYGDGAAMITIDSEYAGLLPVTIRYAAGQHRDDRNLDIGDRTMSTFVGGARLTSVVFPELLVPDTVETWRNYDEVVTTLPVVAGSNTLWIVVDELDMGHVNLDVLRWDRCGAIASPNEAPKISTVPDQITGFDMPVDIRFFVEDPNIGDAVSVAAAGLPPELSLVQIDAATGEWAIQGMSGPAAHSYPITLVASDDASPSLSSSSPFILHVDHFALSPLAGQLVFTEVVYRQGTDITDEAIEIKYIGPSSIRLDLEGIRVVDRNIHLDPVDAIDIDYRFVDSTDDFGVTTELFTNERVLLTMANPLDYDIFVPNPLPVGPPGVMYNLGSTPLSDATLQFASVPPGLPNSNRARALANPGDGVWLLDGQDRLIGYVAWGNPAGVNELGVPPAAIHDVWDPSYQTQLLGTAQAQSISLATDGADSQLSACWEHNGSGSAIARDGNGPSPLRCPDPKGVTVNDDPIRSVNVPGLGVVDLIGLFPGRNTSLGAPNIN